ncbi:MAG: Glycerol-3-phosphate dehydrogenase [Myxococcaceae bacterium]|nr:Glycerol-3-phosphate dehydrogenase [Myxococcaceae bacterium]
MAKMSAVVIGGGSWGTALAKVLAENDYATRLWCRELDLVDTINQQHVNSLYLPGITLPDNLTAHGQLADALAATDIKVVMLVVPSHHLRSVARQLVDLLPSDVPIMSAVKGIENDSLEFPSQILEGTLPARLHPQLTFLSGPSFAKEVALGVPTGVLVAGREESYAILAQEALGNQRLRVYRTDDVIGVEIGGCLKNVVAIAAGISDGLGFGHNSRAALITRGLAEIGRLAAKLGAHPLTVSGLSGMGDLVLTCTGDLSRNRQVGLELGRGKKLPEILSEMTMVAEGVLTAKSAYQLSRREGVEMPITEGIYRVLYEHSDPREEVAGLMARSPRPERD